MILCYFMMTYKCVMMSHYCSSQCNRINLIYGTAAAAITWLYCTKLYLRGCTSSLYCFHFMILTCYLQDITLLCHCLSVQTDVCCEMAKNRTAEEGLITLWISVSTSRGVKITSSSFYCCRSGSHGFMAGCWFVVLVSSHCS